jgi:hypothetical protein
MEQRYIKLGKRAKTPLEPWREKQYTWQEVEPWLEQGGNVGFVTGINDICVLDIDDPERVDALGIRPWHTKSVKTGSGGYHLYYKIPEAKKVVINDLGGNHLGELQCFGQYVVCPPSIHPNGEPYVWLNNSVGVTSLASVSEALEPFKGKIRTIETRTSISRETNYSDPLSMVGVEDIWDAKVTARSGDQFLCEHPVHGSTTGHNLIINPEKNVWQCRRCMSGGGPALAIAVRYGIIRCDEARSGALRGFKYIEVLEKARSLGFIRDRIEVRPGNDGGIVVD